MAIGGLCIGNHNGDRAVSRDEVQKLLEAKEVAVRRGDPRSFSDLLDPQNSFYRQEQLRWFVDAQRSIFPDSFTLRLLSLDGEHGGTRDVFWIEELYRRRKDGRSIINQYPFHVVPCRRSFCDAGMVFHSVQAGPIKVSFSVPGLKSRAYTALQGVKQTLAMFRKRYAWSPKAVEVKLYDQGNLFRQSVKPSLPTWAIGWHEAGESIKLVCDSLSCHTGELMRGIVHELTHQCLSELTGDNAAYWLQEGAAMYYERHGPVPFQGEVKTLWGGKGPFPLFPWKDLERLNLEDLPNEQAMRYYLSAYRFFCFLVRNCGEARIRTWLDQLRRFPVLNQCTAEKREEINIRTRQAAITSLGGPLSYWSDRWQEYEKNLRGSPIMWMGMSGT